MGDVKFMRGMLLVALGLALYSAYCLASAPRVRDLATQVQMMKCDELIRNGPGGRRYVALTEACLLGENSVSDVDAETGALELYHPLYSATLPKPPQPRNVGVVLCITDEMERRRIRDDWKGRERLGLPGLSAFACEVGRGGGRLPKWASDGLKANFPGIQPNDCWVVTLSGYEPTADRATLYFCHGIGSGLAATALLLYWGNWRWRRGRAVSQVSSNAQVC
jgi:hypothetical protein